MLSKANRLIVYVLACGLLSGCGEDDGGPGSSTEDPGTTSKQCPSVSKLPPNECKYEVTMDGASIGSGTCNRTGVVRDLAESDLDGANSNPVGGILGLAGGPEDRTSEFSLQFRFTSGTWKELAGLDYDSEAGGVADLPDTALAVMSFRSGTTTWGCAFNYPQQTSPSRRFAINIESAGDDCLLRISQDRAQRHYTAHGSFDCVAGKNGTGSSVTYASIHVTF